MKNIKVLFLVAVYWCACSVASAGVMSWSILPLFPQNGGSWNSSMSQAVGISDKGIVVGNSVQGPFAATENAFGLLQIWGGINYPITQGVTRDGWVYGYGSTTAVIPWGGDLETTAWQPVGNFVVACCSIWGSPLSPYEVNGSQGAGAELFDFLAQHGMTFVAINPSGQVAANGVYGPSGSHVAFLLTPIFHTPEPASIILVCLGLAALGIPRWRKKQR